MKRKHAKHLRIGLIAGAMLWGFSATMPQAVACPNCKDSLSDDGESEMARLGKGYSTSVIFMLGTLGCVVAGFGGAAYFVIKRSAATTIMPTQDRAREDVAGQNLGQQPGRNEAANQAHFTDSDDRI